MKSSLLIVVASSQDVRPIGRHGEEPTDLPRQDKEELEVVSAVGEGDPATTVLRVLEALYESRKSTQHAG